MRLFKSRGIRGLKRAMKPAHAVCAVTIALFFQSSAEAGRSDSLCVHFSGSPPGIFLRMDRDLSMSGKLPFTTCRIQPGAGYRMIADGEGLERRIGMFSIDGKGKPRMGGIRMGAAMRNAVLPGWGTMAYASASAGISDGLSILASLIVLGVEDNKFRDMRDDYDAMMYSLEKARTFDERRRIQEAVHIASMETNTQNDHRKRLALFSAVLYGLQIVDPWLSGSPPRMKPDQSGRDVEISTGGISKAKAFVYSMIHPGRGQFYQGKNIRGFLLSSLTTAAGLVALECQNRFDEDVTKYDYTLEKFGSASTIVEKEEWAAEASRTWDEVEDGRVKKNAAYIVTAALWGYSLLDTIIDDGGIPSGKGYSMEMDSRGVALVLKF